MFVVLDQDTRIVLECSGAEEGHVFLVKVDRMASATADPYTSSVWLKLW